jgi:hypothetical protein
LDWWISLDTFLSDWKIESLVSSLLEVELIPKGLLLSLKVVAKWVFFEFSDDVFVHLNSSNPQAAQNLLQFSFKDRGYKMADANDHLVFHVQVDGKIVLKDSDDGRDQEDYWDNKKRID